MSNSPAPKKNQKSTQKSALKTASAGGSPSTGSAADDLTVVFLRGNGSPRSFRLPLRSLHRALTAVGFSFAFLLLACLVLLGLSLIRTGSDTGIRTVETVVVTSPAPAAPIPAPATPEATGTPAPPAAGGLWSQLRGSAGGAPPSDPELQKEVTGLRADNARLNSLLDNRQPLPTSGAQPLLQFFGPRSSLVAESESVMRIRNAKLGQGAGAGQLALDFELHNVDPQQRQEKGYIVALAKTGDALIAYPPALFAPKQNIFLDFTRGETFAVSRFRQARATFPAASLEGKKPSFQVILFGTDGKVLANLHVDEAR